MDGAGAPVRRAERRRLGAWPRPAPATSARRRRRPSSCRPTRRPAGSTTGPRSRRARAGGRGVGCAAGWIGTAGRVALAATGALLGSTFVVQTLALFDPRYEPRAWRQFLVHAAFALAALLVDAPPNRALPYVARAAFFWSLAGFVVVVSVAVLACSAPDYQSGAFVYGRVDDDVGWPGGLAWLLGLLQGTFALTGFDATVRMIEEIPEPHVHGPRIMIYCIGIGMFAGFVFLGALLSCVGSVDDVLASASGPPPADLHGRHRQQGGQHVPAC